MDDFERLQLYAKNRHAELLSEAEQSRRLEWVWDINRAQLRAMLVTAVIVLLGVIVWWVR